MPVKPFRANEDDPLDTRTGRMIEACRRWVSSEVGGWTIIVVLLGCTVIGLLGVHFKQQLMLLPITSMLTPQDRRPLPAPIEDLTVAPDDIRNLSADAARALNARAPFATSPNPAAAPFILSTHDLASYQRAVDCMTAAVYYEAANESGAGQAAVAQVIINRSRHPAFPHTICGVIFQGSERTTGCQFSFTCDGSLGRPPSIEGWRRARSAAIAALGGSVSRPVGTSTHYHADYVAPYWAPRLTKTAQIGTHIFYRWPAYWGEPRAFRSAYAGAEPVVARMATLSSAETSALGTEKENPSLDRIVDENLPVESFPSSPFDHRPPEVSDHPEPVASVPVQTPATAPVVTTPPRTQATTILNDPLANPTDTRQQRRRQRLAAPSAW